MPFKDLDVNGTIKKEKEKDPEFARSWDESRTEYRLLAELVKMRKEQNLTQRQLAELTGNKQQVISRIEKRENSPTLKTFCGLLNSMGYDLQIVKQV